MDGADHLGQSVKRMSAPLSITGIGAAFVDAIAPVDDDFIHAHNIGKGVTTLVDTHKLGYLLESLTDPLLLPGGSTANLLCGLAVQGYPSTFIGRTGDDRYGEIFREAFLPYGINFPHDRLEGRTTSVCIALLTPDKERSFVVSRHTASYALKAQDLPLPPDSIDTYICIEANMALSPAGCHPDESVLAAALIMYGNSRRRLVLGLNDRDIVADMRPLIQQSLSFGNVMIMGNMNECLALFDEHDMALAFAKAQSTGRDFIITNGANGAYVVTPDSIDHIPGPDLPPEQVVSTVGAGDQFAAGFIAGMIEGKPYIEAAHQGTAAAGRIIQQRGGRPALPQGEKK
ncbi:MAG: adenosine kinase [Micavibrio aeruginosavorus]|uniref:Adenosine kinase n=1 Tax=Micavibrio aeruginosavorus TaxID=349221 RepID=A0A7T5R1W2_9BACT|nr:MAG: adenosine kinase [Micavibrio aeruginosavorus]